MNDTSTDALVEVRIVLKDVPGEAMARRRPDVLKFGLPVRFGGNAPHDRR